MLLRNPTSIQHNGRTLWYHGNRELLDERLHAVLCSKACPGDKIIEAIDLAQRWRAENWAVISGFHTAVEKECLRIFLRGPQLIVICPARGIDPFQLPSDWQTKYQGGEPAHRLALRFLSPPSHQRNRRNSQQVSYRSCNQRHSHSRLTGRIA